MHNPEVSSRSTISRSLPLRIYQEQENQCSRWSMSDTSSDDGAEAGLPSSFWHPDLPAAPRRPPLRPALNRPNIPPALKNTFHQATEDPDLDYYFDDALHSSDMSSPPQTSSSSSSAGPCVTASATSSPAYHSNFASVDPSFNQWLAAGPEQYMTTRRRALAKSSPMPRARSTDQELACCRQSPNDEERVGWKTADERLHARTESVYQDGDDHVEGLPIPIPTSSSLSLCSSSGWSCVARRTAKNPPRQGDHQYHHAMRS